MPIPRNQNRVAVRRDAPVGGIRLTQPERQPCDTCGNRCSIYNTTGRCHACALRIGYPDNPIETSLGPRRRKCMKGHVAGCACYELRRPLLDEHGVQKTRNGHGPLWVVDVTCPSCGMVREVTMDGGRPRFCVAGYVVRCRPCSIAAAGSKSRVAA